MNSDCSWDEVEELPSELSSMASFLVEAEISSIAVFIVIGDTVVFCVVVL